MRTNPPAGATPARERPWIFGLTAQERSTLIATFGGWALDGMDVMIYSFVIPTLIAAWHISKGQAGVLGTATLLISAVGGWVCGLLADRFGRVRVLQITIAWFALFTFLSGFANSFWQLLMTRGLQGLGFGGEWAVGSVLMGETIRAQHRGKAVGTVQGGWAVGWGIAAISYAVLFSILPAATAWRAMFWIGILPALLVFYIRRNVPEPEVFHRTRAREAALREGNRFLEIFSPALLRTTLLASLLATGAQGGYYAITTWLPTFLRTVRGLAVLNTGGYLLVVIVGSFAGYMLSAWLADRLGRKRTLILFAVCSFVTVTAYTYLPISNPIMMVLGFPLGFFASGSFSPIGAFFTELFPSRLRGSGQGFSYNFGRGIGALFPTLVGYLSARISLGRAISAFAVAAYLVMVFAVLLLPETRGKELQVYE
ncbi:MAG TPA: MFS transporter [Candidatus Sulfotelmatobacter sp.]|nr:MFS transporter [Candidatus Sulfotelmatobacter sp.]